MYCGLLYGHSAGTNSAPDKPPPGRLFRAYDGIEMCLQGRGRGEIWEKTFMERLSTEHVTLTWDEMRRFGTMSLNYCHIMCCKAFRGIFCIHLHG